MVQCESNTLQGKRCKKSAMSGFKTCGLHTPEIDYDLIQKEFTEPPLNVLPKKAIMQISPKKTPLVVQFSPKTPPIIIATPKSPPRIIPKKTFITPQKNTPIIAPKVQCKACGDVKWWCRGCGGYDKIANMKIAFKNHSHLKVDDAECVYDDQHGECGSPFVPCFLCNVDGYYKTPKHIMGDAKFWFQKGWIKAV